MIWAHAEFVACGVNEFAGDTTLFVSFPLLSSLPPHVPLSPSLSLCCAKQSHIFNFMAFYYFL